MRVHALLSVLVAVALVALRGYLIYPELPVSLASHFDGAGQANGWSSKQSFAAIIGAVLALLAAVGLGIPWLLGVLPTSWFNLPHRDYWLAPERVAETRAAIQTYLVWFSTGTIGLVAWTLELTYAANLAAVAEGAARLSHHMWTALGSYLLFASVWLVLFLRRFQR